MDQIPRIYRLRLGGLQLLYRPTCLCTGRIPALLPSPLFPRAHLQSLRHTLLHMSGVITHGYPRLESPRMVLACITFVVMVMVVALARVLALVPVGIYG